MGAWCGQAPRRKRGAGAPASADDRGSPAAEQLLAQNKPRDAWTELEPLLADPAGWLQSTAVVQPATA